MKKFALSFLILLVLGSASAAIVSHAQLENKTNTGKVTLNDYNTLTGAVDVLTDLFNGVVGEVSEISFSKSVKVPEICLDGECATAWPVDPNSPWSESGSDLSFVSGNVGIGVALPTEKLQVAGDLDLSGDLIKDGSPVIPACVDGQELIFSNDRLACGDPEIECDTDLDCDDSDNFTSDTCADAGTINAICLNEINRLTGNKIYADDAAADRYFGFESKISGNNFWIGSMRDATNGTWAGAMYGFDWDGETHAQIGKLVPDDLDEYHLLNRGAVKFIGALNQSVAIGATNPNPNFGASTEGIAYFFLRKGDTWSQVGQFQYSDNGAYPDVAISASGHVAVIGDTAGSRILVYTGGVSGETWLWNSPTILTANDGGFIGDSVAVANDYSLGSTIVSGDSRENAVYVFKDGSQEAKISMPYTQDYSLFGNTVALSVDGNTLLVGDGQRDLNGLNNPGAVTVYTRSGSTWSEQATLTAPTLREQEGIGRTIALSESGNTALISGLASWAGEHFDAVYVYKKGASASEWNLYAVIKPSDGATGNSFGTSISISEDENTVLIGAYMDDDKGVDAGAAYIMKLDDLPVNCSADGECDAGEICENPGTIKSYCAPVVAEAKGLIAEYLFNGDATDSSPYGNHGTITGAEFVTDRFGNANGAIHFPDNRSDLNTAPTESFVEIPSSETMDFITNPIEGVTVVAWIKMRGGNRHQLFRKLEEGVDPLNPLAWDGIDIDVHPWGDNCNAANTQFGVEVDGSTSSLDDYNIYAISTNPWHQVAIVTTGGNSKYYLDGQDINRPSGHSPLASDTTGISAYIGNKLLASEQSNGINGERISVTLDDVQIYDTPLSSTEIAALYQPVQESDCTGETPYKWALPDLFNSPIAAEKCVECNDNAQCGAGEMCDKLFGTCASLAWFDAGVTSESIQIEGETGDSMCLREGYAQCTSAQGRPYRCSADINGWHVREATCSTTLEVGSAQCEGVAPPVALFGDDVYSSHPDYVSALGQPGDTACSMAGHGDCIKSYDSNGEEIDCTSSTSVSGIATCEAGTCTPTTCAALGETCGIHDDGCGGSINCGECVEGCPPPATCSNTLTVDISGNFVSWTGILSGDAACAVAGYWGEGSSYIDGVQVIGSAVSSSGQSGTATCDYKSEGEVGVRWAGISSGDAECAAVGYWGERKSFIDGVQVVGSAISSACQNGVALCEYKSEGEIGVRWTGVSSGDAECAAVGYWGERTSYIDGVQVVGSAISSASQNGVALCEYKSEGEIGVRWTGISSGDAECAAAGYWGERTSYIDGVQVVGSAISSASQNGVALCEYKTEGDIGVRWTGISSGDAECAAIGKSERSSYIDGAPVIGSAISSAGQNGVALCQ